MQNHGFVCLFLKQMSVFLVRILFLAWASPASSLCVAVLEQPHIFVPTNTTNIMLPCFLFLFFYVYFNVYLGLTPIKLGLPAIFRPTSRW